MLSEFIKQSFTIPLNIYTNSSTTDSLSSPRLYAPFPLENSFQQSIETISHSNHRLTTIINKIKTCIYEIILFIKNAIIRIFIHPLEKSIIKKLEKIIIKKFFSYHFDYSLLETKILDFERNSVPISIFNNYDFTSYKKLKKIYQLPSNNHIPVHSHHEGGIKTYQAIVSLYVRRFLKRNPDMNRPNYSAALHLIALRIAIKDSADEFAGFYPLLNSFLPPKITVEKAAKMEFYFLRGMDWNISTQELVGEEPQVNHPWNTSAIKV